MKIKIQRLSPEMKLPKYARADDAGMDLFSCEDYTIQPKTRHTFSLGFALELPRGYVSLIWDKSGLASKQGLTTLGGVIEWSYRGEYKLILHNTSDQPYDVKKGDKLAQMLIQPVESVTIEEVDKLSDTERGSGGFGSTGR